MKSVLQLYSVLIKIEYHREKIHFRARSDTNQAVQAQNMTKGLIFQIEQKKMTLTKGAVADADADADQRTA